MIDTHAHLYLEKYDQDRPETLARLQEAGVEEVYLPGLDKSYVEPALELQNQAPETCLPMLGLHPCYVKKDFEKQLYALEDWLKQENFLAIGEIGFDLYWDKSFLEQQHEAFKIQCGWALEKGLPIAIHCRDAFEVNYEALAPYCQGKKPLKGVWHCFAENLERANKVIELGFKLGINGIATFKNGGLDKVLPHIDLAHIVLETDCPYLAPSPHRGKRNEPAYLELIAQRIADLKGLSVEEVKAKTTENARALFQPQNLLA